MLNRTPLYETHVSLNGKIVPFAGWEMPLQFQSILAEARAVRSSAGLFDVSHMGRIWVRGRQAAALLDWITTANVPALAMDVARYTLICTEAGGILDDGIIYRLGQQEYLLICNASNRKAVWDWLSRWHESRFRSATLDDRTAEVAMIAYQGPRAAEVMGRLSPGLAEKLRTYRCAQAQVAGISALVGRTGYTGEDGFEFMPSSKDSPALWQCLLETGAVPCGLGARDVLRLEAGMLLHGTDMDKTTNPFEAGLDRFVFMDKESVCSEALKQVLRTGLKHKLIGFEMVERGVPRHGYAIVRDGTSLGHVTSGGYSPTLDRYIGMGYVALDVATPGSTFQVDVRGKTVEAKTVALPFYSRRRN